MAQQPLATSNDNRPPLSPFSEMLFKLARESFPRSYSSLAEDARAVSRAWADDQDRLPEPSIPAAQPFEKEVV